VLSVLGKRPLENGAEKMREIGAVEFGAGENGAVLDFGAGLKLLAI
jgi:hypothetical protein